MGKGIDPKAHLEAMRIREEAENFANRLMIGNCPRCGSERTKDCAEVVGLEDPLINSCLGCGFMWCNECGHELIGNDCPHWTVCDGCEKQDEKGSCPSYGPDISECPSIKDFWGERR